MLLARPVPQRSQVKRSGSRNICSSPKAIPAKASPYTALHKVQHHEYRSSKSQHDISTWSLSPHSPSDRVSKQRERNNLRPNGRHMRLRCNLHGDHTPSASVEASAPSWASLRAAAGAPAPRLFDATERLFGASQAEVIFWRDSAGWCPFCCMTWLLLEQMRVPYRVRTVPLRRYMRDGERKDPEYTAQVGPNGVVPGVQFRDAENADEFGSAVQNVDTIFEELAKRYPASFPSGDPATHARACEGSNSVVGRLRVARRAYEACAGAKGQDPLALGLGGALQELDAMLAASGGPYLGGGAATVADLMALAFLERAEACVPYFFGRAALAALPFPRAAAMLRAAREDPSGAFRELCSDATTLARTNLRYAAGSTLSVDTQAAAAIDGTAAATRDEWLAASAAGARRDAAARLATRPAEVAAFARRCADLAHRPEAAELEPADPLDAALRQVAALLLVPDEQRGARCEGLVSVVETAAEALMAEYGAGSMRDAALALDALSLNVGVPRDMDVQPARALRSHARVLMDALEKRARV